VLAGLRRRRHVDALPVNRELEAMIGAADAVLLVAAEVERRTAVRAEFIDQPDLAVAVAKGKELSPRMCARTGGPSGSATSLASRIGTQ